MTKNRTIILKSQLNKLTSFVKKQNKPSYLKQELKLDKQVYVCQDPATCSKCKFYKQSRGKVYCIAQRLDEINEELDNLREEIDHSEELTSSEELNRLLENPQNSEICPGCGYPYDSHTCFHCGFVNDYDSYELFNYSNDFD